MDASTGGYTPVLTPPMPGPYQSLDDVLSGDSLAHGDADFTPAGSFLLGVFNEQTGRVETLTISMAGHTWDGEPVFMDARREWRD